MEEEKTVYFAHPISHYNTEFEWECIETIYNMLMPIGADPTDGLISVMNPNQKWLSDLYQNRRSKDGLADTDAFEIFREVARSCDMIVGVSFFDGALGTGVAEEMREGLRNDKEVYLLLIHDSKKLFFPVSDIAMPGYKILSRKQTRLRKTNGVM